MSRKDNIRAEGRITEALGGDRFSVELDNGVTVTAVLSGRMRMHRIRVTPGDRVAVEMSPYDLTRGIVSYRFDGKRG